MLISLLLIIAGFLLLIKGADWLVDGAAALARKYNISDLAIGLTIVAFGTSAPELLVNIMASVKGANDIVLGNIIGSNILNLLLILGLTATILPIKVKSSTVWKEIPISLLAVILLWLLANNFLVQPDPVLSFTDGLVLLVCFSLFLYYVYYSMKSDPADPSLDITSMALPKSLLFIIIGLASLIFGGRLVLENAEELARTLGVSEKIIGMTIIAGGTSLPELVTSLIAAFKKNNDIAMGNIVGSNIFNILFVLGVSTMITPVEFDLSFNQDLYFLAGITLLIFGYMFISTRHAIDRWKGLLLLIILGVYNFFLLRG